MHRYFLDEDGIFSTDAGFGKGVYAAYVVPKDDREVLMYIGETGKGDRCFRDRCMEHAHYWTLNPLFYTGVKREELEEEGYKFLFRILAVEKDNEKRYALEQYYVETMRPYKQSGPYPKYDTKSKYRGLDLCIFPTYLRRAFLFAKNGVLPFEAEKAEPEAKACTVDKILAADFACDWSKCTGLPSDRTKDIVLAEMPKGSQRHLLIKKKVDMALGFAAEARGCTYKYLVKLVSNALDTAKAV